MEQVSEEYVKKRFQSLVDRVPALAGKRARSGSSMTSQKFSKQKSFLLTKTLNGFEVEAKANLPEDILDIIDKSGIRVTKRYLPVDVPEYYESKAQLPKSTIDVSLRDTSNQSAFVTLLPEGIKEYHLHVSEVQITVGQKCGCDGCLAHYCGGWIYALAYALFYLPNHGYKIRIHYELVKRYLNTNSSSWCDDAKLSAEDAVRTLDEAFKSPKNSSNNATVLQSIAVGISSFEIGRRIVRIFPSFGLPKEHQKESTLLLLKDILASKQKKGKKKKAVVEPFLDQYSDEFAAGKIDSLVWKMLTKQGTKSTSSTARLVGLIGLYSGMLHEIDTEDSDGKPLKYIKECL